MACSRGLPEATGVAEAGGPPWPHPPSTPTASKSPAAGVDFFGDIGVGGCEISVLKHVFLVQGDSDADVSCNSTWVLKRGDF